MIANRPLKSIRKHCLDCCCGSTKAVKYCPADGLNSKRCELWSLRFGLRPETAKKRLGKHLLNPHEMPTANTSLDSLPV